MRRYPDGTWILNDDEMNLIAIWASEVSVRFNDEEMYGFAQEASFIEEDIYNTLKESGYYK